MTWSPTPGGGYTITELGKPAGTRTASSVTDINNGGQAVGRAVVNGEAFAVTWNSQGNIGELPVLPGITIAEVRGINNKGRDR